MYVHFNNHTIVKWKSDIKVLKENDVTKINLKFKLR